MPNPFEVSTPQNQNVASKIMGLMGQGIGGSQQMNEATVQYLKMQREEVKGANEYAVNLLSKVNSEEDLQIAKDAYRSRYPQFAGKVDELLPSYDPNRIQFLSESMKDMNMKLKEQELSLRGQELDLNREKLQTEQEKPIQVPEGSIVFQGGKQIFKNPKAAPKPDYDIFEDANGEQFYIEKGSKIPSGAKKVKGGTGVTVNVGDKTTVATQTQLEKDIIEATKNVQSLKSTGEKFKDEYLTWWGKGSNFVYKNMDKAGMSTKDQQSMIKERAKWFRQAKSDFIAYRKWATGVAGGEKEMEEIATSFPDPVQNSPSEYKANLAGIEETTKSILSLNRDFLQSGINLNQPLNDIIKQMKEKGIGKMAPLGSKGGGSTGEVILRFDSQGNLIEE